MNAYEATVRTNFPSYDGWALFGAYPDLGTGKAPGVSLQRAQRMASTFNVQTVIEPVGRDRFVVFRKTLRG